MKTEELKEIIIKNNLLDELIDLSIGYSDSFINSRFISLIVWKDEDVTLNVVKKGSYFNEKSYYVKDIVKLPLVNIMNQYKIEKDIIKYYKSNFNIDKYLKLVKVH